MFKLHLWMGVVLHIFNRVLLHILYGYGSTCKSLVCDILCGILGGCWEVQSLVPPRKNLSLLEKVLNDLIGLTGNSQKKRKIIHDTRMDKVHIQYTTTKKEADR